jgi:hypothetical protein
MKATYVSAIVAAALAGTAGAAAAQSFGAEELATTRIARAPEWSPGNPDGFCRLRVWVDDRARVELRGDQVMVRMHSGRRSYDTGTACNQPLPFHRVEDFRVTSESGRGALLDVAAPARSNDFTGALTIDDPQGGGDTYEILVAWRNPGPPIVAPVAVGEPYPAFDDARACQARVRRDFLARNEPGAWLEFTAAPLRDDMGPRRDRIRGEAWARGRFEARPVAYECVVNERTNRVVASSYEVLPPRRYGALR